MDLFRCLFSKRAKAFKQFFKSLNRFSCALFWLFATRKISICLHKAKRIQQMRRYFKISNAKSTRLCDHNGDHITVACYLEYLLILFG